MAFGGLWHVDWEACCLFMFCLIALYLYMYGSSSFSIGWLHKLINTHG